MARPHTKAHSGKAARGVASTAGAGVETNLLCVTRSNCTELLWSDDLSHVKIGKKSPMRSPLAEVAAQREELVRLKEQFSRLRREKTGGEALAACRELQARADKAARDAQDTADAIDAASYDLKAVNPRAWGERDQRQLREILESIASHGDELAQSMATLRTLLDGTGVNA